MATAIGADDLPGHEARVKSGRPTQREDQLWQYDWDWLPGDEVANNRPDLLEECADLYSVHYGVWAEGGGRGGGERIQMSTNRLRRALQGPGTRLAYARLNQELVGYCTAVRFAFEDRGEVVWVSQLVVHATYRHSGVGTRLLYGVWQFSNCYAWGLATVNPLAVRALETATRRPCRVSTIRKLAPELLPALARHVEYLPTELVEIEGRTEPRVNTHFNVDLGDMTRLRDRAKRHDRRWTLGDVGLGEEWFACTFRSQEPGRMSPERLEKLLQGSDGIWIDAYERMTLDGRHAWRRHAASEVDYIVKIAQLQPGARVLDVGCADGRHAHLLSGLGFEVVAVDISTQLIERARTQVDASVKLRVADARDDDLEGPYDLVVCLYDVLGSSAERTHDLRLLRNLGAVLAPGGTLVVTVMNAAVTLDRVPSAQRPQTADEFVAALEFLAPSATMETTGNVFDPNQIVLFNGLHYRKEQFESVAGRLPSELVVRDLRYTMDDLLALMTEAGFVDASVKPAITGRWADPQTCDEHDQAAKELLVMWRRGPSDGR
ncbi:MAG: class I SAM-dependent methyltransferase [Acidimicrobiales bacterium]